MISNRGELRADLSERIDRSDMTARVLTSIQMATKRFNRELRVPQMEVTDTATLVTEWTELPADFLEIRAIETGGRTLEYVSPWRLQQMVDAAVTGTRHAYTIADMQLRVYPIPDDLPVSMLYYARIDSLDVDGDTNWLLDEFPDAYVDACMGDLCKYLKDFPRAAQHEAFAAKFIDDINRKARSIDRGSSPMVIRVA